MLSRRRVIAAKVEAVEGTGETLAAADGGILAIEPKVDVDIKMFERNVVMATLSKLASLTGSQLARLTFGVEIKGAGATYSATVLPALGKYLKACGFSETVDVTLGAEKVTYKPASSGVPSVTIGCYEDGVIKRLTGARGNVAIAGKLGEPIFANFDFLGVWDGVTDGAMIAPTYEGTIPSVLLSGLFTVGGYAAIISGIDVDMANVLTPREDINKATGYISTLITDRRPTGKLDPEMIPIAAHDWYGRWKSGVTGALNIGAIGAVAYNKVQITAPKLRYTKVSDADRGGNVVADTNFELVMNTGDDEIVIVFS